MPLRRELIVAALAATPVTVLGADGAASAPRSGFMDAAKLGKSKEPIVVTSDRAYRAPGAQTAPGLDAALALATLPPPAFCIGGAALYREALGLARTLHLTEIERAFDGDVRFPAFDRHAWIEVARERHADEAAGFAYAFVRYERRGPR